MVYACIDLDDLRGLLDAPADLDQGIQAIVRRAIDA
jgi:hypothetical protein